MNTMAGIQQVTALLEEAESPTADEAVLTYLLLNYSFGKNALQKGMFYLSLNDCFRKDPETGERVKNLFIQQLLHK